MFLSSFLLLTATLASIAVCMTVLVCFVSIRRRREKLHQEREIENSKAPVYIVEIEWEQWELPGSRDDCCA